jgi:predicted DNA-binding protein (MmcQ/YjbR family)
MPRADLITHCRRLPASSEDLKWGHHVCFSVGGKLFVIFGEDQRQITVKVAAEDFGPLTAIEGIVPAPYLARAGWVMVTLGSGVGAALARRLLSDSWRLVAERLPAGTRSRLGLLARTGPAPRRQRRTGGSPR